MKLRDRATLRSIADHLGIHVSTVSRVLNGTEAEARSAASPQVIKRIRDVAKQLNYRPNRQAIGLKTRRTRLLGVVSPRMTDLVVATIYEGIDAAAKDNDYLTFVGVSLDVPERQIQLCETALDQNVEGLIIGDARLDRLTFLEKLARRNIPMVLVSRHAGPAFCSVTCDDHKGGRLAADHLLALGHRDICVMAGEPFATTGRDRTVGFIERCAEAGVIIPSNRVLPSGFDTHSGRKLGEQVFARGKRPTAVFAVNDFLAIGLMGTLRDQGIQVGRDVAVMGFNDTPIAAELPIALSTVRSPMHRMGYRSVEVLLETIRGGHPPAEFLEPVLCVRESSDPNVRVYPGL